MNSSKILSEIQGEHLSDYLLIRLRAGELAGADRDRATTHLDACESCRDRQAGLADRQAAFLNEPRALDLQAKLRVLPERTPSSIWNRWLVPALAGGALAAIAAAIWWIAVPGSITEQAPLEVAPVERIKGVDVKWVVARSGGQLEAGPGFDFQADDRIGIQVTTSRPAFVTLFSINEQGGVRVLLPKPDQGALRIPAGRPTTLSMSLTVAEPVETERVFVLLSAEVLEIQELVRVCGQAWAMAEQHNRGLSGVANLPLSGHLESRLIGPR